MNDTDLTVTDEQRFAADMADGLRNLADAVDAHPELAASLRYNVSDGNLSVYPKDRGQLVTLVRVLKSAGAAITKEASDQHFRTYCNFGPVRVRLVAAREEVCERVVIGTKEVTTQVPDPAKLAEVPLVDMTETVETVEWVCHPLLADAVESRVTTAMAGSVSQ